MSTVSAFHCDACGRNLGYTGLGVGYGYDAPKPTALKACYRCCAEVDKEFMREHGRITLYLTLAKCEGTAKNNYRGVTATVSNWPGSLKFENVYYKTGKHNWGLVRYDVWFRFEGFMWHGVRYGDNTELCHCKRTKEQVRRRYNVNS